MDIRNNTLMDLFNSSGDPRRLFNDEDYYELHNALKYEIIKCHPFVFVKNKIRKETFCGGGESHLRLCNEVASHLVDFKSEYQIGGKRVDIFDEKNNSIWEIGDTDPGYVRRHLSYVDYFYSVPFQCHHNRVVSIKFWCDDKEKLKIFNDDITTRHLSMARFAVNKLPELKELS